MSRQGFSPLQEKMPESESQDESGSCSGSSTDREGPAEVPEEAPAGPKGHRNLAIRGGINVFQCCCSLLLASCGVSQEYFLAAAGLSACAAATLLHQWHTANPWMFVARGLVNFAKCLLSVCQACHFFREGWHYTWSNDLWALKACHGVAALLNFLKGRSLLLQYRYPKAGMGIRGNEQLFYRGVITSAFIFLHFFRGMYKLGELTGTEWERSLTDMIMSFVRMPLVALTSWSLLQQWVLTGFGRQTDDVRSSYQGEVVAGSLDRLADIVEPHRGDRNLLIRSISAAWQGTLTACLIFYSIDVSHKIPRALSQFTNSVALFVQWRTGSPRMFLVRATSNAMRGVIFVHLAYCGRRVYWNFDECASEGWGDVRAPFRKIHVLAAVRMFAIAWSLAMQFWRPQAGVTDDYGNEQLFYRGVIVACGVPLFLFRGVEKLTLLRGTEFDREPVEEAVDFLRAFIFVPLHAWSLIDQWQYSGRTSRRADVCDRRLLSAGQS